MRIDRAGRLRFPWWCRVIYQIDEPEAGGVFLRITRRLPSRFRPQWLLRAVEAYGIWTIKREARSPW